MQISIATLSLSKPSRNELTRSKRKMEKRKRSRTSIRLFNWLKNSKTWTITRFLSKSLRISIILILKMAWLKRLLPKNWNLMVSTNSQKELEYTGVFFWSGNLLHLFPCCCGVVPHFALLPTESEKTPAICIWVSLSVWLFWLQGSSLFGRLLRVQLWWTLSKV